MAFTVAVLGATGQLGTDIVHALRNLHPTWTVLPLSREDVDLSLPISWYEDRLPSFDVLVNTAAFHKVDAVEAAPHVAFMVNAWAVRDLAAMCRRASAHFVHISTDYVFGGESQGPLVPRTEYHCPAPLNVYGASKLTGESLALDANPQTAVVRVASLFGKAGSSGKGGNFVETMLRLAREGKPIKVVADQMMSPTYTVDAAHAIVCLIEQRASGLFHCAGADPASWFNFAQAILAGTGADLQPCLTRDQPPSPVKRPAYSVLDSTRLTEVSGFAMPTWSDAIVRYLRNRDV